MFWQVWKQSICFWLDPTGVFILRMNWRSDSKASGTNAEGAAPGFVYLCWALMPSSGKGTFKRNSNWTTVLSFTVDKLQFEPPLRKETEAHSEMVIIR